MMAAFICAVRRKTGSFCANVNKRTSLMKFLEFQSLKLITILRVWNFKIFRQYDLKDKDKCFITIWHAKDIIRLEIVVLLKLTGPVARITTFVARCGRFPVNIWWIVVHLTRNQYWWTHVSLGKNNKILQRI